MKDAWMAIRLSLKYKWSILGSILSSVMIAFLFGASITTVLPFVKVVFSEKTNTLEKWVNHEITVNDQRKVEAERALASLPADQVFQRETEQKKLDGAIHDGDYYRWVERHIRGRVPSTPFGTLFVVIIWLFIASVLKGLFLILSVVLVSRVANRTVMDMQRIYYRKTLEMDTARIEAMGSSAVMTQLSSAIHLVSAALMSLYGRAVREPLKMLTCLIGAAYISFPLLLLSLVVVPFGMWALHALAQKMKKAITREMGGLSAIYQTLMETINGIKTVRIFNREQTERVRFKKEAKTLYKISLRIALFDALVRPVSEVVGIASFAIAVLAGGYLALNQQTTLLGVTIADANGNPLSPEAMILFFIFLAGISDPARKLSEITNVLARGGVACKMLREIFDEPPGICAPEDRVKMPPHSHSITFENVYFSYQPDTIVLNDVSFEVPFGQTIALVGANGCGKSTIVSLLPRLYDVVHGSIKIDGIDIRNVHPKRLRRQFAWVTQDAGLFQGTIYDNIAYGKRNVTEKEIRDAADLAGVTEFLNQIENGIQTEVGNQGMQLSAGQRQRVALARAIVADPRILILDEATSQMDGHNEKLIHGRLRPFIKDRTTFIVSHRASSLELADRVLVMEQGRIIADGPLEQLENDSERFNALFRKAA